jgi:hypothetical protein
MATDKLLKQGIERAVNNAMHLRKAFGVGGFLAWVICMVVGFTLLQEYAATAGASGPPAPDADGLVAAYRRPQHGLVAIALHPMCPCTDASLSELGDLLARSRGKCDAIILEYRPLDPPADWPASTSYRELAGVKVPVITDRGGRIAIALGAHTSGHAVFIDASGAIRFHGGLTAARGHRGRTAAHDGILAALGGATLPITAAPVFGCALEFDCKPESAP